MNCPFHVHSYNSAIRSYRELPIRYAEEGTVYRYERSGVLHGLMRVRGFTQDDAHHFCRPDQMPAEIDFVLEFSLHILRSFGFLVIHAYLSTKPEKSVGDPEDWRAAEAALEASLQRAGVDYEMDLGGGAFYGTKIDLKVNDAIGREWQLSTIQFDFNLPERFNLTYIGEDGQPHRPYMVHRALLGSMQAALIPIPDRHLDYARAVAAKLRSAGLRVMVDHRSERMNAKIRDAQNQKIQYMLVVGDKECETGQVALRLHSGENPGLITVDELIQRALMEIEQKV